MQRAFRFGLAAALLAVLAPTAGAQAPATQKAAPPATRKAGETQVKKAGEAPAKKAGAQPATPPPRDPRIDQVLATCNGEKITRGEVVNLLNTQSQQITPGSEEILYQNAVDYLVRTKLLYQFLKEQKIPVTKEQIDEEQANIEKTMKARDPKANIADALATVGVSLDEFRKQLAPRIQWNNYLKTRATDAELKKYFDQNKDVFSGTQVRASHILIKVDPDAKPADKQKAKEKILAIKKEIESGKISFADAANKYSEDQSNQTQPSGGDVDYFFRKNQLVEPFAAKAFSMKQGEISDPVETEYGYHLIQVTGRKEGQPRDFAQMKDQVMFQYAADQQQEIVNDMLKTAKVDTKPMPTDLFAKAPAVVPGGTAPAGTPAPAQPKGTTTPKAAAPKAAAPKAKAGQP
jgi:peptidyl-prolyl cis-trans isomerase C